MADNTLDALRHDALARRVKGMAGGNHIVWSAKDIALIRDYVMEIPEKVIRAAPTAARKFVDLDPAAARRKFANAGIAVKGDMQPGDLNFLFTISSEQVDLAGDVITIAGVDCSNYNKNPVVLNAHDSSELPIAVSTAPWVSGTALMATARFPPPGISAESDQVAAAMRASLVRGASVGFIPLKWSFTKDPARPFGVDFQTVRLLEWSVCAVPCNPGCLVVGAVSGKSASAASIPDPAPLTREQRIEQARNFRRIAEGVK
jgi:hypothetical protein